MYKESHIFETPPEHLKIWRYLDFTKFIDLLECSKLFFCRLDKLKDPYEGVISENALTYFFNSIKAPMDSRKIKDFRKYYVHDLRIRTAVNCWQLNTSESDAMWKSYVKNGDGLAIQSTIKLLKNSLKNSKTDVYIGRVKYVNIENPSPKINPSQAFSFPVIFKGKEYKHDQELRAIIQREPLRNSDERSEPLRKNGAYITVELGLLINKIILAPKYAKWKFELIKKLVDKHGLDVEIVPSSLDNRPLI